jgi:hypothetical protein
MSNEDTPTVNDLRKILLDHGHRIIEALKKEQSMSRFQPDEPEVTRDKHEEEDDVERCPHGYTLAWYETRSQVCEDCKYSQAELQASESVGK